MAVIQVEDWAAKAAKRAALKRAQTRGETNWRFDPMSFRRGEPSLPIEQHFPLVSFLLGALDDLSDPRKHNSAVRWFKGESNRRLAFTFDEICAGLGLDATKLSAAVFRAYYAGKLSLLLPQINLAIAY